MITFAHRITNYELRSAKCGLEHRHHSLNAVNECIDFVLCIIKCKGSAHRTLYAKTLHKGVSTMMTGTYCYAETVE